MKSTKIPDVSSITLLAKVVSKKTVKLPTPPGTPRAWHFMSFDLHCMVSSVWPTPCHRPDMLDLLDAYVFFGCLANQLVINSVVVVLANRLGNITYIYLHIYIYIFKYIILYTAHLSYNACDRYLYTFSKGVVASI